MLADTAQTEGELTLRRSAARRNRSALTGKQQGHSILQNNIGHCRHFLAPGCQRHYLPLATGASSTNSAVHTAMNHQKRRANDVTTFFCYHFYTSNYTAVSVPVKKTVCLYVCLSVFKKLTWCVEDDKIPIRPGLAVKKLRRKLDRSVSHIIAGINFIPINEFVPEVQDGVVSLVDVVDTGYITRNDHEILRGRYGHHGHISHLGDSPGKAACQREHRLENSSSCPRQHLREAR